MVEREPTPNEALMDTNPYRTPAETEDPTRPKFARSVVDGSFGWVIVFVLNLPVVLFFAMAVVEGTAWYGVAIGTGTLLMAGAVATKLVPRVMKMVTSGGLFMAVTQFMPIAQLLSGSMALDICSSLGLASNSDDDAVVPSILGSSGGFVATMLTALPLIGVAFVIGGILHLWKNRKREPIQW